MSINFRFAMKPKILLVALSLVFVVGAHGDDIIQNQVEDLNILTSQVFGGQPNVLMVYDSSYSMGTNFGGAESANWDNTSITATCAIDANQPLCGSSPNTDACRAAKAHCMGNASGINPCGSAACSGSSSGTCALPDDFERFLQCVESKYSSAIVTNTFSAVTTNACGGSSSNPRVECTTNAERARAAAAMENFALLQANAANSSLFPLTCGASLCSATADADKSCNAADTGSGRNVVPGDYSNFVSCMNSNRIQPTAITCTDGKNCSQGRYGSTRLDAVIASFFDFLDADPNDGNRLSNYNCDDPNRLFNGTNTSINCHDFMNTPFRDLANIVSGQSNGRLPITNASDIKLEDILDSSDLSALGLRIRPIVYGGGGAAISGTSSCTGNSLIKGPQGGFAGGSQTNIQNIWRFFNQLTPGGRSILAGALGFDDNYATNSTYGDDALRDFELQLRTGGSDDSCAGNFTIIISNGQDQCSGDGSALPGSAQGANNFPPITGNANRRSTIQAVSNLRTHFVRNNLNNGEDANKEIITFVICLGVNDPKSVRTCNGMALGGGTHTTGIIQHTDPDGNTVGAIDIDAILGAGNPGLSKFARALGIESGAYLTGCRAGEENEATGACAYSGDTVFENAFFNNSGTLDTTAIGESFAFFADSPEDLTAAITTILGFIESFPTTGVAPTAPQSSTAVGVRDRVFLSLLRPITDERLWQGRLALYGFADDPGNPGSRVIIRKPANTSQDLSNADVVASLAIFDSDGTINDNAKQFFWEAGKNLAERNLNSDARRLFTIDRLNNLDTTAVSGVVQRIRYRGDLTDFLTTNSTLTPDVFGISDADVTNPIPSFCASSSEIANCTSDCSNITSDSCRTCVKTCIKDKIIGFMSGNTEIDTRGDPLGEPTTDSCSGDPSLDKGIIGCGCPNLENDPPTGSFARCSVRLGDMFHTFPVLVGSPSPLFFDTGFQNFARGFRNRSAAVYSGANDGFIHSFHAGELVTTLPATNPFTNEQETVPFFNEGSGKELFAYAPPSFLTDSIAPSSKAPTSPSGITPDYRLGDFKTFIADNLFQRSFADGSPLVADVFVDGFINGIANDSICTSAPALDGIIDPCGKEWHSVLLAGYRNGGGAYTALDVTNPKCSGTSCASLGLQKGSGPTYPKHLWTVFDKNFGNTWSNPTIGRVRMTVQNAAGAIITTDRWLMFAGGGLHPTDTDPTNGLTTSMGNAFYAIDIPTGNVVFKFHPEGTLANDDNMVCDVPSDVGVYDLNADGYADIAMVGDTCGRMWEFDISRPISGGAVSATGLQGNAVITAPNWTGHIAFCANTAAECAKAQNRPTLNRQPIFFPPSVVLDQMGRRHVIFTTGNRRNPTDPTQFGKLYNFIDPFVPSFLGGGSPPPFKTEGSFTSGQIIILVPQTGTGIESQFTVTGGGNVNGEFIVQFPDNPTSASGGEKGFGTPVVINGVLVFTTFAPDAGSGGACSAGFGLGRVFALDYLSGVPALIKIPGAQGLLQGSDSAKAAAAGRTVAEGLPSPARLTYGTRGSVILTLAFSGGPTSGGASFLVWEAGGFLPRTQTFFWEEIL
ncbi:MAG: PilC/PilY family type IV pilus protein [Deltaproteobacteria bacterium]